MTATNEVTQLVVSNAQTFLIRHMIQLLEEAYPGSFSGLLPILQAAREAEPIDSLQGFSMGHAKAIIEGALKDRRAKAQRPAPRLVSAPVGLGSK
jgi:hypothetical protein